MTAIIKNNNLILRKVKSLLAERFNDDIKNVILFGSRAEERAKADSDYDILVVLNKEKYDWNFKHQIIEAIYDIELEYDVFIDIHIISAFELNNSLRGTQPIFQKAIKNGVYA
jgi:predicted nucleotidyltransferase